MILARTSTTRFDALMTPNIWLLKAPKRSFFVCLPPSDGEGAAEDSEGEEEGDGVKVVKRRDSPPGSLKSGGDIGNLQPVLFLRS
jgi:hypothetical protein